jgi:hypothetical protein
VKARANPVLKEVLKRYDGAEKLIEKLGKADDPAVWTDVLGRFKADISTAKDGKGGKLKEEFPLDHLFMVLVKCTQEYQASEKKFKKSCKKKKIVTIDDDAFVMIHDQLNMKNMDRVINGQ